MDRGRLKRVDVARENAVGMKKLEIDQIVAFSIYINHQPPLDVTLVDISRK